MRREGKWGTGEWWWWGVELENRRVGNRCKWSMERMNNRQEGTETAREAER